MAYGVLGLPGLLGWPLGPVSLETAGRPTGPGRPGGSPAASRAGAGAGDREAELRAVAREFEALFLEILLKEVRRGTEGLGGGGGSLAQDIYMDWFDQRIAERVAAAGGTGLGDVLYRALAARYLTGPEAVRPPRESA